MSISDFKLENKTACMELFLSNEGKFFDPSEKTDFERFLRDDAKTVPYYVIFENAQIVASGGFTFFDGTAYLCWGMVKRSWHKSGVGTLLLKHRLREIEAKYGAVPVKIDTSQHTQAFYQKFGFEVTNTKTDGFGPGIDEVTMIYRPNQ